MESTDSFATYRRPTPLIASDVLAFAPKEPFVCLLRIFVFHKMRQMACVMHLPSARPTQDACCTKVETMICITMKGYGYYYQAQHPRKQEVGNEQLTIRTVYRSHGGAWSHFRTTTVGGNGDDHPSGRYYKNHENYENRGEKKTSRERT